MTSISAFTASTNRGDYCVAKAGFTLMTKLFAEGLTPINRWGQPSDVGRAVAAIAMGHFPYSTEQVFEVDGGFHLHRF